MQGIDISYTFEIRVKGQRDVIILNRLLSEDCGNSKRKDPEMGMYLAFLKIN